MRKISRKERALLTIAGAQRLAGAGRTPTARQVRKAHAEAGCAVAKHGVVVHGGADSTDNLVHKICGTLSGIGGETDAECGSFWSKLKSIASDALPLAPLFGPTAAIAAPVAKAIAQRAGSRSSAPAQSDDNLQQLDGDDFMGFDEISHPAKNITYMFGAEDRMLLREGGSAERAAIMRRSQRVQPLVMGRRVQWTGAESPMSVPHVAYRAMILRLAKKTGGASPKAKQMAEAQAAVDRMMARKGLFVGIPGARPGRVTR